MPESREPLTFGTVIIVGGGCYGSYYLRQLERASAAHALAIDRLLIVDRDPGCQVAQRGRDAALLLPEIITAEWTAFFAEYLGHAADSPGAGARDAIVPSPLMPHLLFDWLRARIAAAHPDRSVEHRPLEAELPVPWQRAGDDGTHYASFATWMCPINCIEPPRCPHTRATRDWTMPVALERHAAAAPVPRGAGPYVFHCTHRAYGVGMVDIAPVLAAEADLRRRAA
ncbi:MAG: hypothetical protein H0X64_05840, partial [Gemmatimonadaceae bacterium]|nr:hypothetical protein [Gemmatimonadaceae bacterium]